MFYSGTNPHYKVLLQYSVLQSIIPVLLNFYSVLKSIIPYYKELRYSLVLLGVTRVLFVVQSTAPSFRTTKYYTLVLARTTQHYSGTTK